MEEMNGVPMMPMQSDVKDVPEIPSTPVTPKKSTSYKKIVVTSLLLLLGAGVGIAGYLVATGNNPFQPAEVTPTATPTPNVTVEATPEPTPIVVKKADSKESFFGVTVSRKDGWDIETGTSYVAFKKGNLVLTFNFELNDMYMVCEVKGKKVKVTNAITRSDWYFTGFSPDPDTGNMVEEESCGKSNSLYELEYIGVPNAIKGGLLEVIVTPSEQGLVDYTAKDTQDAIKEVDEMVKSIVVTIPSVKVDSAQDLTKLLSGSKAWSGERAFTGEYGDIIEFFEDGTYKLSLAKSAKEKLYIAEKGVYAVTAKDTVAMNPSSRLTNDEITSVPFDTPWTLTISGLEYDLVQISSTGVGTRSIKATLSGGNIDKQITVWMYDGWGIDSFVTMPVGEYFGQ